jgi:L-seryl-tRNA(Ser) seleniumtransferase
MLTMRVDEIEARARKLMSALEDLPKLRCELIDGESAIGGGSAPGSVLPTRLMALTMDGQGASGLESRLRAGDPPAVARIEDGRVVIDMRTVGGDEDGSLVAAIRKIAGT